MVNKSEIKDQKRKKPDWYYQQVAVLPFRVAEKKPEILLITSVKKKKWILPKGIAERDISPPESAANEAFEEAGVKGEVLDNPVGNYSVKKWGGICNVQVYPMQVHKEFSKWPENYVRKRKWFSIESALKHVSDKQVSEIIRKFESWFEQHQMLSRKK